MSDDEFKAHVTNIFTQDEQDAMRSIREDLIKQSEQCAMFPELVIALKKANDKLFQLDAGIPEFDEILERADKWK